MAFPNEAGGWPIGRSLTAAAVTLALGSLLSSGLSAPAQAKVQFNVPDLEAPGNREAAAQRSGTSCLEGSLPLVALVPETNIGLTTQAYPQVHVYLPPTTAASARFVVVDDASGTLFYEETFALTQPTGGVVTLSLPNNGIQQGLALDRSYSWYFSVVCDQAAPDANPVVDATIRRTSPPAALAPRLEMAAAADLPALYAEAGLWYDALAASSASPDPASLEAWQQLLEAVDLASIAAAPLLSP